MAPGGTLAANPEPGVALRQTLDAYIRDSGRSDLAPAARAVRLRQAGRVHPPGPRNRERRFTVVAPVGDSGWSLLVAQSYDQIVARLNQALWLLAAVGTLLALTCMLVVRKLAKRISLPMEQLAESTTRFARGQYDWPVPHTGRGDEVGRMARTLEHARTSIQRQLQEIGEMGAARQKLHSELSIARDIQHAMLSPPRVDRTRRRAAAGACAAGSGQGSGRRLLQLHRARRRRRELWFAIGDVRTRACRRRCSWPAR